MLGTIDRNEALERPAARKAFAHENLGSTFRVRRAQQSCFSLEQRLFVTAKTRLNPMATEALSNDHSAPNEHRPSSSVLGDLRVMLAEVYGARELLYQLALRDVSIRYKQAVMGFGWAVLIPLLVVFSGVIVRYAMATLSGQALGVADIAGVATKSVPWSFFVGAIGFATGSLVSNMNLVTKVAFPRAVLPISAIAAQAFDSAIALAALSVCLIASGTVRYGLALLWAPFLILLLLAFTLACGLLLSCANLFFRDVKYLVQVFLTFGIFVTPVLFESTFLGPVGSRIMMVNPLAPILEGLRLSITQGANLLEPITAVVGGQPVVVWSPLYLAWGIAASFVGLTLAAVLFQRLQYAFAESI